MKPTADPSSDRSETFAVVRLYERPSTRHNWRLIVEHPESLGFEAVVAWGKRYMASNCPDRLLGVVRTQSPWIKVMTDDILSRPSNDPSVVTI